MSGLINTGVIAGADFDCGVALPALTVSSETDRGLYVIHNKYLWGILVH